MPSPDVSLAVLPGIEVTTTLAHVLMRVRSCRDPEPPPLGQHRVPHAADKGRHLIEAAERWRGGVPIKSTMIGSGLMPRRAFHAQQHPRRGFMPSAQFCRLHVTPATNAGGGS